MEPHHEEPQKALEVGAGQKLKRFRIVKLEERIAPRVGEKGTNHTCNAAYSCWCTVTCHYCQY